jgi:hypothetical protein
VALGNTTAGEAMNKSGTLIASALLTFGIAAAAMAADPPQAPAPMPANSPPAPAPKPADAQPPGAPTVGPKEDQRAVDTAPPTNTGKPATTTHKHKKKPKPVTPVPTTTN